MKVWVELKYGDQQVSTTLWKVDDLRILRVLKSMLIGRLEDFAKESEGIDKVIHTLDKMNLKKAQQVLNSVISDNESGNGIE